MPCSATTAARSAPSRSAAPLGPWGGGTSVRSNGRPIAAPRDRRHRGRRRRRIARVRIDTGDHDILLEPREGTLAGTRDHRVHPNRVGCPHPLRLLHPSDEPDHRRRPIRGTQRSRSSAWSRSPWKPNRVRQRYEPMGSGDVDTQAGRFRAGAGGSPRMWTWPTCGWPGTRSSPTSVCSTWSTTSRGDRRRPPIAQGRPQGQALEGSRTALGHLPGLHLDHEARPSCRPATRRTPRPCST